MLCLEVEYADLPRLPAGVVRVVSSLSLTRSFELSSGYSPE